VKQTPDHPRVWFNLILFDKGRLKEKENRQKLDSSQKMILQKEILQLYRTASHSINKNYKQEKEYFSVFMGYANLLQQM
jgi:hypothetical protein